MRFITILIISFSIISCKEQPTLEGFVVRDSGLEFKLVELGDETMKLQKGDLLVSNYSIYSLSGELLASSSELENSLPIEYTASDNLLDEALSKMVVGDSAALIINQKELPKWMRLEGDKNSRAVLGLRILDKKPEAFFKLEERFPGLADGFPEDYEALFGLLDSIQESSIMSIGDMYFIGLKDGKGNQPSSSDIVNIDFEGYFTTGEKFDSTKDRNESFEYTIGELGQVLLGFNLGVRQLKEGGEAIFILPSHMAFDKRGSTDGTVPPNTTVIYRVRLNKVIKNEA